jgi:hypothetical protein
MSDLLVKTIEVNETARARFYVARKFHQANTWFQLFQIEAS